VIEIRILPYREFEVEYAKVSAGPNWQYWLASYQRAAGSLLAAGFVYKDDIRHGKLIIYTHTPSDETIIHEMVHWACHEFGPEILSSFHRPGSQFDCTGTATFDIVHSLKYRNWLRDRPWRD